MIDPSVEELVAAIGAASQKRARDLTLQKLRGITARAAYSEFKIGIITALPKEAAAVKSVFGNKDKPLPGIVRSAFTYRGIRCKSIANGEMHNIVLCQSVRMGNNSAAAAAAALLSEFDSISDIIMVGIAGGVPDLASARDSKPSDSHVRLGDIVISDRVLQYDFKKLSDRSSENRSAPAQPSARLLSAVQELEQDSFRNEYPWMKYISALSREKSWIKPRSDQLFDCTERRKPGSKPTALQHPRQPDRSSTRPMIHRGVIGSANILLKNADVRDSLRSKYNIRAVEMEASGVADSAWSFGIGYLAVRGICDYCDAFKNDKWQNYAALGAAAYTRAIIEKVPA